jgi:membrane-associated protease RseP (regulator of RpoE activity)
MFPAENDVYTPIVNRFLRIDDATWGEEKKGFLVRYRGTLYNPDTAVAYEQLADALREKNVTPLFRLDENRHSIVLLNGIVRPKPSQARWNILLFVLTFFSVLFAGGFNATGTIPDNLSGWVSFMISGLPFTIALLTILLCHEFGHYLAGRYHKTAVTLPYFIPLPVISFIGTMGALIQLKEPPRNRRILLDIGIAGPLAGLIVAIPILIYGLTLSPVQRLPAVFTALPGLEGNSILYLFIKFIVKGQLLPQPATYAGLNPIIYWIRYFFTGRPLPVGGLDVTLNPVAWAAWVGLLVTALNLVPAGQFDGGHLVYVLLGKHATKLLPFILVAVVLLGLVWNGWWLWALLIFFLGRFHAEPLDEITPLDSKRKALAILGIVIFVLVFMPVPFI